MSYPPLLFASAFPRPSSWALAYTPTPRQRSYRGFPVAWRYSSDQPFVGQPLPCGAVNEAIEPLQGMPLHIALIEPESELVNVPAKMLRADMVEGAVNAAFQDGPDAFDAVGRNAIANVFAGLVVDRFVRERPSQAAIAAVLI